jgi:hypothetical protein
MRTTVVCVEDPPRLEVSDESSTGARSAEMAALSALSALRYVDGGTLGLSKRTPGGTLHRIDFDPPLRRGQHHTFSVRERVPDTDPEPDLDEDFSGQSFESPALRYRVEVHFLGEQPAVVWRYDKLSRIERPGVPEDGLPVELQICSRPDGTSGCTAEFADLYGGLCAGVAWRWNLQ